MPRHEASGAGERPILRLGVAGYTARQVANLQDVLNQDRGSVHVDWEVSELGHADAWCINGARVQPQPDGTLCVSHGLPSGRMLRVQMDALDLPVAFSNPRPDFRPPLAFRIEQPDDMRAMLGELEVRLRPLVVQYHLAAQVLEKRIDLRRVHHVSVGNRLIAVMSMRDGAAMQALIPLHELDRAVWVPRPDAARVAPPHFVTLPFPQLMWQYALRTRREWLPTPYRSARLYLRRPPALPLRLLTDHSLLLVRELGRAPGTMKELAERTGLAARELSRCLGALTLVGSITSDPRLALAARHKRADDGSVRELQDTDRSGLSPSPGTSAGDHHATVKLRVD